MNPFAISGLLTGISSAGLAFLVYFKSPNKKLGFIWLLYALAVAMWGFGTLGVAVAKDETFAIRVWQFADIFGILAIPTLFYHFVCIFCELDRPVIVRLHYSLMAGALLLVPTPLVLKGLRWVFNSFYYTIPGPIYPIYAFCWFASIIFTHVELLRCYKTSSDIKKTQIKYFLLATIVGFSGGSLCFLPALGIDVYPWGNFAIPIYSCLMSYAILKHRLMDITVIIRKTFFYSFALIFAIGIYVACVAHFTHRAMPPLSNFSKLTAALSGAMAIFVILKGPRTRMNVLWSLTCFSIAIWSLGFGMMIRSISFAQGMFWQTWFLYVGAIMIPLLFLHFVNLLTKENEKITIAACYLVAFIFQILNILGKFASLQPKPPFNFYTTAIFPIYHAYTAYFLAVVMYAHWLLIKKYRRSEGALKNQIGYVLLGMSIAFCGGSTTFPLVYDVHFFPMGVYIVPFFIFTITYAIFKHHLMDINLVLRKSLVYSLMTGFLTAIYLIVVNRGTHVLQDMFGASALAVSIITACFITAIFLPMRNQFQVFVDRYFFHDWADQPVAREIAAGFSHELKSPLAGLSMQAQLALEELKQVEDGKVAWLKALPKIKQELQYLVDQSMDAARRIEAVRGVAEPARGEQEPVHVSDLIASGLVYLRSNIGNKHVSIRRDIPEHMSPVFGDAKQLEIVFINLLKNALQAMDGKNDERPHSLSLNVQEREDAVYISIRDAGPEIPAKDISRIFEPYFTTKGQKGTGMGLYLSQQIIKAHGGSIEVRSEEGKGTEFIVRLPKYVMGKGSSVAAA